MSQKKKKQVLSLQEQVLKIFKSRPGKHFSVKQVFSKVVDIDRIQLMVEIDRLVKHGIILKENNRFVFHRKEESKGNLIEGIVDMTSSGSAYIVSEKSTDDIYVHAKNLGSALDGDKVRVSLVSGKRFKRPEGKVVEVMERATDEFIGTVQLSENFAFLIPDKVNMPVDIFIPKEKAKKAKNGDKAVVKIIEWHTAGKNPIGEITEVLGKAGVHDVEMKSILIENGFPLSFPGEVLLESEGIPFEISGEEIARRKDFREITTFTIDPEDAKDFDDAISIRKLKNGNWEIGVHIADVSHYVKPGSAMDKEAYKRATSVYLVDRVLPMFPEKLSNDVCSLRPQEEKLCFSAVFEMNSKAQILHEWFGKTVIFSDKRFTYEEAQKVLETKEGIFAKELQILNSLAYKLRDERFANGSINFETVEVKFVIDEMGTPLGIKLKERKDAHLLIEDFMLLANKRVAEYAGKKHNHPFVYRVHDLPDEDKLSTFAKFAGRFGYRLNLSSPQMVASSLNKLMEQVNGKKEQNLLEQIAIRTMAKAYYTTKNIGHYGLAFDFYTHFTSPIRRYPDVMVHRMLEEVLSGAHTGHKQLEENCKHASLMERNAMDAERESVKYKQVEFMQSRMGEEFEGIISGVTEWGLYVEAVETKCEGLVRVQDMEDDFYKFDADNYCLTGQRHGKKFQLGDSVRVRLIAANLEKRTIDFVLA